MAPEQREKKTKKSGVGKHESRETIKPFFQWKEQQQGSRQQYLIWNGQMEFVFVLMWVCVCVYFCDCSSIQKIIAAAISFWRKNGRQWKFLNDKCRKKANIVASIPMAVMDDSNKVKKYLLTRTRFFTSSLSFRAQKACKKRGKDQHQLSRWRRFGRWKTTKRSLFFVVASSACVS